MNSINTEYTIKIEKRAIKFYLDEAVNKVKKDKIIRFLSDCQEVQNEYFAHGAPPIRS